MSVIDELVANATSYSDSFDGGDLPLPPAKRVAIVACMDARLNRTVCSACKRATLT
jgi:carbonic anhydrase